MSPAALKAPVVFTARIPPPTAQPRSSGPATEALSKATGLQHPPRPRPEECKGAVAETEGTARGRRTGNVAPLLPGHSTATEGGE